MLPSTVLPAATAVPTRLRHLFALRFGRPPLVVTPLAGDASPRRIYRLLGGAGATAVGVRGDDPQENCAFLAYSRAFRRIGLPVPEVYAVDEEGGAYLLEDLGDTTLYSALSREREGSGATFPPAFVAVYRRVLEILPRFQVEGGRAVDYAVAHPRAAFDRRSILWDLSYFKYHFLKLAHVPFHEDRLEDDFERLAARLLESDASHFLYRDFQSRNVMLRDGEPWFLDYQGGRRGALPYDVASLLYDAKAELPESVRTGLLEHYLEALASHVEVDRGAFRAALPGFVLVRILQALGAYGYRGFYERKSHMLQSVTPAVQNLRTLLQGGRVPADLPELRSVLARLAADERFEPPRGPPPKGLTVHVRSFAFKQGAPGDPSGHGGGYVFDCRALPNPGREAHLRDRTGRDAEVVSHLEENPLTLAFWERIRALVEEHVRIFRARSFSSLTVAFGCTGGRHRSVYLAERLAHHLRVRFPDVGVDLAHGEEARWPEGGSA